MRFAAKACNVAIKVLAALTVTYAAQHLVSCATGGRKMTFSPYDEDVHIDFGDEPYFGSLSHYEMKSPSEDAPENEDESANAPSSSRRYEMDELGDVMTEYGFSSGKSYPIIIGSKTLTDLVLEGGEQIMSDIAIANPSLILTDIAYSIEGGKQTPHLLFRAAKTGETAIVIPTNRRTYYLKATLTDEKGMLGVRFKYRNAVRTQTEQDGKNPELTNLRDLDYGYVVSGDTQIRPAAVFSSDKSTYIQFSKRFYYNDVNPALYIQDKSGMSIVNYTIKGNMYITDFVLERGEQFVLISGKSKVFIEKEGALNYANGL